jgi:hypothetical protein
MHLMHLRSSARRLALSAALIGFLVISPSSVAAQDAPFAPISGLWDRHGFGITVNDDGSATATWRVYQWCGPGVADPCDRIVNNRIISGGHAEISFAGPDDSGAFAGEVTDTSDPELLDVGPLTLTPQPYDMAMLEQGDRQLTLCGEDSANQAPMDVLIQCGA